ncbi:MAG: toxin-antitoxin system YwqK family antitoxin [Janthinobacterium lividum]
MNDTPLPVLPASAALPYAADPRPDEQPVLLEERDAAGRLLSRTPLLRGEAHGRVTHFGANETPLTMVDYRHGQRHGELRCYDERGQLIQNAMYRSDVRHGTTTLLAAGRVASTQQFLEGLLHGETVCYAANGLVAARLPYRLGLLQGEATYFQDGQVVRRATYQAGMLDGVSQEMDAAGRMVRSAHYRANVLHGALRRYWPDGEVMEETIYRHGIAAGTPRKFDLHDAGIAAPAPAPGGRFVRGIEKLVRG